LGQAARTASVTLGGEPVTHGSKAKVVGVHASDSAYWELQEQMDALDTTRAA
jgi:hypothetical protein